MSTVTDATNSTTTSATSSTGTSATSSSNTTVNENDFLQLLIAQMQNQDPLNPMDGTQYVAELAQFSSLQELQDLNTNMTTSINANYTLTQSINNTLAGNLIGQQVKVSASGITAGIWVGEQSTLVGGVSLLRPCMFAGDGLRQCQFHADNHWLAQTCCGYYV